MNYEQSQMIEELYRRFRAITPHYTRDDALFANEERKLHNAQMTYWTEEQVNDWIRERHNNLLKLEQGAVPVTKFRVYSKHPSAKTWLVERTYTLRLYADQAADSIRRNGRQAMVREVKQ